MISKINTKKMGDREAHERVIALICDLKTMFYHNPWLPFRGEREDVNEFIKRMITDLKTLEKHMREDNEICEKEEEEEEEVPEPCHLCDNVHV